MPCRAVDPRRSRRPPCSPRSTSRSTLARRVWVEADIRQGLPAFTVVGLADKAVREARERVRAAMVNSGFEFPLRRITVNLAPAYLRKVGPAFDLPLAVALLVASYQLEPEAIEGCAVVGELSLTGEVRPVRGALAVAEGVRRAELRRLVLPRSRAREAALVPDIEVARHRLAAGAGRDAARRRRAAGRCRTSRPDAAEPEAELADVRGHNGLIPGLEVAAAGGHNLFLQGPPGTGKTMIARRLPSILPPLGARGGDRGDAHPVGRRPARRRRPGHRAPVPGAAPHGLRRGPRRRRRTRRSPARRRSPIAACCSSTSSRSSPARASRRCASRSRTAT